MAKTWANAAVALALAVGAVGSPASAAERAVPAIALHVADFHHLPPSELAISQKWATRPYTTIGVRVVWTDGAATTAPPDGARHFDVVILSEDMTREKMSVVDALGEASAITGRAYIHYWRILTFARQTTSDPLCVLAMVMAHEVGHMLLPEHSHTSSGLMRGNWPAFIARVPGFLPAQAAAIRAMLAATVAEPKVEPRRSPVDELVARR